MTTHTTPLIAASEVYPVLPACDIDRAEHFYHDVLGLEIEKTPQIAHQFMAHAGGDTWVLVYRTDSPHGEATAATFMVGDLDKAVSDLRERGIVFEEYNVPGIKTVDAIATLGAVRSAWFKDSEGNVIALSEVPHS